MFAISSELLTIVGSSFKTFGIAPHTFVTYSHCFNVKLGMVDIQCSEQVGMGPLQLAVTWYKIYHAGEQATHWDIHNKENANLS